MVDALDDESPALVFVGDALVMTVSCDIEVKELVAVGLIVCGGLVSVLLLALLTVLDGVAIAGVAEVSTDEIPLAVFDAVLASL